jgi:hypothetical protein
MAQSILPVCLTADGLEYEYREYAWGDVIEGSKEVLLRMGIGVGIGFPGEPGSNKRRLSTTDPRGFPCAITVNYGWARFPFCVYIQHPGRGYHNPAEEWKEAFPGVQRKESGHAQYYKGTADALSAVGIVPAGMFPGMPGMRSVRVTILADGTLPTSHRNSGSIRHEEGGMTIEKCGKYTYEVSVTISSELGEKRWEAAQAHRQAWEDRMMAMPRAPRIDQAIRNEINEQARHKRAALRVVWSRPKFVPQFNILPQGSFAR